MSRAIDPPPGLFVSRARATDVAAPDATRTTFVKRSRKDAPDTFVRTGGSNLRASEETPADGGQLEQAKRVLDVLRGDPVALLRSYYPVLEVARALAAHDELADGVAAFVHGKHVSVPDDLQGMVALAAGIADWIDGGRPEAARPLGQTVCPDNNVFQPSYQAMQNGLSVPRGALQLDDASVQAVTSRFFSNAFNHAHYPRPTDADKLGVARMWARACELGLGVSVAAYELNQMQWPQTPAAASVLRRLAAAARIPEAEINFGSSTLDRFRGEGAQSATRRATPASGDYPTRPVGRAGLTSAELQKRLAASDPSAFALDDAGLELFVAKQGQFYPFGANATTDPKWHLALMKAWERAAVLGFDNLSYLAHYTPSLHADLANDEAVMMALARLIKRAQMLPSGYSLGGGVQLDQCPVFKNVWAKLDRVALGILAPVPSRRALTELEPRELGGHDQHTYSNLYNQKDPRAYDFSDAGLHATGWMVQSYTPEIWAANPAPGVLAMCARLIELGGTNNVGSCSAWLVRGVQMPWADDAMVPGLARLANAAGVPFDQVTVHTANGPVLLSAHPALPRVRTEPGLKEMAFDAALAAFDGTTGNGAMVKLANLERILDVKSEIELSDVLRNALAASRMDKLAPIDAAGLDASELGRLASALCTDGHLGLAAVFTALFATGADKAVRAELDRLGYTTEQLDTWQKQVTTLRGLTPEARDFALRTTTAKPEMDFLLLPLRIDLASARTLSAAALEKHFDAHVALDPAGVARALVERAALASKDERALVAKLLTSKVESGELAASDLTVALADGRHRGVMTHVDDDLDEAVRKILAADAQGRPAAISGLVEVIQRHSQLVDSKSLVVEALDKLHQADLAAVLPLVDADRQLGRPAEAGLTLVAGKWHRTS